MANVRYGNAQIPHLIFAEEAYYARIYVNDGLLNDLFNGVWVFDLADSDRALTEAESAIGTFDFTGVLTADRTITIDDDYKHGWWVRDRTTGGNITLKPTSSNGQILPKGVWVWAFAHLTHLNHVLGLHHYDNAGSISYGTNWGATSGRTPRLWKYDATQTRTGGLVRLEGAVEKSTADPAINDTILTLPVYYRPAETMAFVVPVNSDVTTASEQGFGPIIYTAGSHANATATHYLRGSGKSTMSANVGYCVHRAGSITGISGRFNVLAETTPGTVTVEVLINDSSVFSAQATTSGTGAYTMHETQAPGVDLVAAGDLLTFQIVFGTFVGTTQVHFGAVELLTTPTRRTTTVEISTAGVMSLRGPLPEIGETIDLSGIQYHVGS